MEAGRKKIIIRAYNGYLSHNIYNTLPGELPVFEKIGFYKSLNIAMGIGRKMAKNREDIHIISCEVLQD